MDTATLVKENAISPYTSCYEEKLHNFLGVPLENHVPKCTADTLKSKGLVWFVNRSFEDKFKYKAGINGSYKVSGNSRIGIFLLTLSCVATIAIPVTISLVFNDFSHMIFLIPMLIVTLVVSMIVPLYKETVIDYVGYIPEQVYKNACMAQRFGIKNFRVYSDNPLPVKRINLFEKVDPVMVGWINKDTGVVIGVWDKEKEIHI